MLNQLMAVNGRILHTARQAQSGPLSKRPVVEEARARVQHQRHHLDLSHDRSRHTPAGGPAFPARSLTLAGGAPARPARLTPKPHRAAFAAQQGNRGTRTLRGLSAQHKRP